MVVPGMGRGEEEGKNPDAKNQAERGLFNLKF
jgi:hypothetical protein